RSAPEDSFCVVLELSARNFTIKPTSVEARGDGATGLNSAASADVEDSTATNSRAAKRVDRFMADPCKLANPWRCDSVASSGQMGSRICGTGTQPAES